MRSYLRIDEVMFKTLDASRTRFMQAMLSNLLSNERTCKQRHGVSRTVLLETTCTGLAARVVACVRAAPIMTTGSSMLFGGPTWGHVPASLANKVFQCELNQRCALGDRLLEPGMWETLVSCLLSSNRSQEMQDLRLIASGKISPTVRRSDAAQRLISRSVDRIEQARRVAAVQTSADEEKSCRPICALASALVAACAAALPHKTARNVSSGVAAALVLAWMGDTAVCQIDPCGTETHEANRKQRAVLAWKLGNLTSRTLCTWCCREKCRSCGSGSYRKERTWRPPPQQQRLAQLVRALRDLCDDIEETAVSDEEEPPECDPWEERRRARESASRSCA